MTACGHLSQTLDGLDGARKENGGLGMEEPRASIPLDYRFLHLSFYRYKRKRKGDAEKMEAVVRGTKTIEEFKRVREECFALPLFFMLFSGLHIMIVKRKRMENRKYLVARSPFVK